MPLYSCLFTLTAVSVAIISDVVSSVGEHSAKFKSIQSSYGECNQYLSTDGLRQQCDTRCVALVNRIWNDTTGLLSDSTGRFYTQELQNPCSRNRTKQCLKEVISTVSRRDSCKRAQASVDCYLNNYGQLDVTGLKYVPFTDIQQVCILKKCAAMLGVSDKLDQVVQNGMQSIPEGDCLLRCLLIQQALYSDESGPDLMRLSVQCNGYGENEAEWRANVTQCVAAVQAEGSCDKCAQAAKIASECLVMNLKLYMVKNANIRKWIPYAIRLDSGAINAGSTAAADANAGALAISESDILIEYYAWYFWIY
ncbi:general odorant-binding protein 45-like [Ochlerotatus camptorhynchus]|uniref:general odorant-binding protein 45-like n=1 Tax=Ochlerotatus camptorhynchus TaxID=644619 RepID=UPI0031E3AED5